MIRARLLGSAMAIALVSAIGPVAVATSPVLVPTAVVAVPASAGTTVRAETLATTKYKNCTALNKKYKHGVGKKSARDKVRGKTKPVTNFKRDTALYKRNSHLDRDKDGVACEKR